MIFKTWLNDLSMVSKATEGINMSMMAVGAADYSKAIDGLSLSQAKLLLNMQGVDAEQQKSLLLQAGLISSSEKMTASHVAQALSNTTLKNTEQERVLIKAGLMNAQTKELILENNCTEAKLREALATTTLDATEKDAIVTRILGANANGGYAISFDVLTASIWANIKAMAKWLVTNPVGWCILAVGAIAGVSKIIDELVVTEEELNEQLDELSSKWEELSSTIQNSSKSFQSLKSQADELIPRYAELAQGVDKYGKNVSLTDEEFSEFVSLNNQLGQMFPELVMGYDSNGNAILALSGNVDTLTESLYAFVEAQRIASAQTIADTMPKVMSNIDSTVEAYEAKIQNVEDERQALEDLYNTFKNEGFVEEWSSVGESMVSAVKILDKYGIDYSSEITGERNGVVGSTRYKITVDWDDFETAYNGRIAGFEKEVDDLIGRIEAKWKQLNPVVSAWLSTDFLYQDLDMSGQSLVTAMVGKIDFKSLGLKTEEEIQNYITNSIITPIYDMDTKTQQAFFEVFDLHEALNKGELSVQEYQDKINAILENGTYSQEFTTIFKLAFAEGDLQSKYNDAINRFTNDSTQTLDDVTAQYQEVIDSEYQKIQDWGLGSYAQQIKDGTIQSVFGNVDMDKRTIITWSDELKQTYKDALDSWDYDPEVGGIDTVFGGSDRFGEDLNGVGWEVAFTPILPDGTFLSQDAVYDYINTILVEAYANDGKITEDELTKIDAQGRQIGNTFIHGIFAGIDDSRNYDNNGNWAETVGRLLHFSGDFGAVEIAKREKEKAIKEFSDSNVDLEKFFADNSINTTEEIDYWNKVTEGAESAKEAVEMYNKAKGQNPDKITVSSFTDAWSSLDTTETDEIKDLKENLLELAKAGRLTIEAFQETDSTDYFENLGISAEEAVGKINKLVNAEEQLKALSDDISAISNALATKKEDKIVDVSTLQGFNEEIRKLDAWDNFAKLMGDSKSSMEDCQDAANKLATEWVNNNNFLSNLDDTTAQYYTSQLKLMGVENAEAVVSKKLANNKEALRLKYQALNAVLTDTEGKTSGAIAKLFEEERVTNTTKQALANLVSQEILFNNSRLDVSQKISALNQLAYAAFGVSEALNGGMGLDSKYYNGKTAEERIAEKWRILTEGNLSVEPLDISPNGTDKDKDKSSKSKSKEIFDWIEIRLEKLSKKTDKFKQKFEDAFSLKGIKNSFKNTMKSINKEISANEKAYDKYLVKANSIKIDKSKKKDSAIKKKIQDGSFDISTIKNDKLKEKIENYQTWWDKAQACKEKVEELHQLEAELPMEYGDKIIEKYDTNSELYQAKINNHNSALELYDAQGVSITSDRYRNAQNGVLSESENELQNRKNALKDYENWYKEHKKNLTKADKEASEQNIQNLKNEVNEAQKAVIDARNAINETDLKVLQWDNDEIQNDIDTLEGEIAKKEARGISASKKDYQDRIKLSEESVENLLKQNEVLKAQQVGLEENSEEYQSLQSDINANNQAIQDAEQSQIEWNEAIDDMDLTNLEKAGELLGTVNSKYDKLKTLAESHGNDLSDEKIVEWLEGTLDSIDILKGQRYEVLNDIYKNISELNLTPEQQFNLGKLIESGDIKTVKAYLESLNYSLGETNELTSNIDKLFSIDNSTLDAINEAEEINDMLYEKEINRLNKLQDTLQKEKDIKDRILATEKARFELEKAKANLTKKVWNGEQWVYTADKEAVQSAQEAFDNNQFDNLISAIKDWIDVFEEVKKDDNLFADDGMQIKTMGDVYEKLYHPDSILKKVDTLLPDVNGNMVDWSKLNLNNLTLPTYTMPQVNLPAFDTVKNNSVTVQNLEISLPNINDASTARDLAEGLRNELSNLGSYAKQFDWK